jgi:hypothetical protein
MSDEYYNLTPQAHAEHEAERSLAGATGSGINTDTMDWFCFAGTFAMREGFNPNPNDQRVHQLWNYWKAGKRWGEHTAN